METAQNAGIEMIDTDADRARIPIPDRKPMEEAWNWLQVIPAMKKNHESDRVASHQLQHMLVCRPPLHICQILLNMFRFVFILNSLIFVRLFFKFRIEFFQLIVYEFPLFSVNSGHNATRIECCTKSAAIPKCSTSFCIAMVKPGARNIFAKSKW